MTPRISVVINNHNYERFLGDAIESVLSQTGDDAELIVVDDGSTDSSRALIEAYGDRLTAVFQDNAGQGTAVSNGFAHSTGAVLVFLDADDTLLPGALASVARAFDADEHLVRLQWPMTVTDESGASSGEMTPDPSAMVSGDLATHIIEFRTHVWPATSGNAYARSALDELLPVPDGYEIQFDLYLAETTPFFGRIRSLTDSLSTYRNHGSNVWLNRTPDAAYLRQKIDFTVKTHSQVVRVARSRGFECPDDPTRAKDVAFVCQRLASLRLDPSGHPIAGDTRWNLTVSGIRAAVAHPHHTRLHKLKRIGWIVGVGLGSSRMARALINRFYG